MDMAEARKVPERNFQIVVAKRGDHLKAFRHGRAGPAMQAENIQQRRGRENLTSIGSDGRHRRRYVESGGGLHPADTQ